jgi:hypothetical protein
MLVAMHGGHNVPHAGAAILLIVAIAMFSHGRGPLLMLLAPILPALDTLLGAVAGDVEQCLLATAWGHLPASLGRKMFGHLIAGGILGGDTAQLLGGVPKNIVVFTLA